MTETDPLNFPPPNSDAHILTWNPEIQDISDSVINQTIKDLSHQSLIIRSWNVGRRTQGINSGDTVYLLRQGQDRPGIIAHGIINDEIHPDVWDIDPDKEGKFITYELHKMVTVDNRLKMEDLVNHRNAQTGAGWKDIDWKFIRASGRTLIPEDALELHDLWDRHHSKLP